MTVRLLVEWPDSRDGKRYLPNNLLTTDAATEAGLVAAKLASTNLAGGTAYVPPPVQAQRFDVFVNESGLLVRQDGTPVAGGTAPTAPGAPTAVAGTAGDGSALLTATPPSNTGGLALDRWRFTPYIGSNAGTPVEGATLPVLVAPLNNGQAYTFRAEVRNAAGLWSALSAASQAVTPQGAAQPVAPTISAPPANASVQEGGSANFNVAINGTYDTVQWQTQAPGSSTWEATGGNSTTLPLSSVALGANNTKFRARAGNQGLFSAWSAEATLTVTAAAASLRASAPFDAQFSGLQNSGTNDGRIECGNVTLRTDGDWAIFVSVAWRTAAQNMGGGILSIGDASDTIFTDSNVLGIGQFGSGTSNPWSDGSFAGVPFVMGRDPGGVRLTNRTVAGRMVPGSMMPYVLLGKPSTLAVPGNVYHSYMVTCESGVVKFWDCDPGHEPILQDAGPGGDASAEPGHGADSAQPFTGIVNKPLILGMINQITQNSAQTRQYWGGPISQIIVYNGGAISKAQARLLSQGIDARDVLAFDGARGDRYWPGNQLAGDATKLEELIAGQHGTIVGAGVSFVSKLMPQLVSEAVTCGWRPGTVWTAANSPATTTALRMWGNRRGPGTTTIQARIVATAAAFPAAGADILQDWSDVATGVAEGPWAGDFVVPHLAGYWFTETRFRKADNSWSDPVRLQGQYAIGDGIMVMGQSILAKFNDDSGTRAVSAPAQGKINTYNKHFPVYSINRVLGTHRTGWLRRAATTYSDLYGQTLYCDLLANITGRHAFMIHSAIQGIPLSRYNVPGNTWDRCKEVIQEARPKNMIWSNGQGDAAQNEATRWPQLDLLYNQIVAAVAEAPGGAWDDWVLGIIPVGSDFVTAGLNTTRNSDMTWVEDRQAKGWKVCLATTLTDVPNTLDGVHYRATLNEMGAMAERLAAFVAWRAGFSQYDANGGYMKTATYTYDAGTQTLTVKQKITGGNGTYATKGGGNPSGIRLVVNNGASVVPTSTSLAGDEVTSVLEGVASAPASVGITYLSGYPGPTAGGATTPEATSGIDNALYDVRTGMVSASKGMPVRANPVAVVATPA